MTDNSEAAQSDNKQMLFLILGGGCLLLLCCAIVGVGIFFMAINTSSRGLSGIDIFGSDGAADSRQDESSDADSRLDEPSDDEPSDDETTILEPTVEAVEAAEPLEFSVPIEGFNHITNGESGQYNHFPPSSGDHYSAPAAPIAWGIYDDPSLPSILPEVYLHNLEHSGIVILFNCPQGCPDTLDNLADFMLNAPDSEWGYPKIIIAPNDLIETQLVALAWGWQLDLEEFNESALLAFYNSHIDDGPENVP